MEKEVYWSRFAGDFEKRDNYVVGKRNIEAIQTVLFEQAIGGKVLELGCGNGTYSRVLARAADHVFAIDWSDEMVSVSHERLKSLKNITVEKQNCFNLPYPDSDFDAVVMVNLLHVIPEPEKAIEESKRVLRANGDIIVISFTMEGLGMLSILGMIYRYLRTYGKPPKTAQSLTLDAATAMIETNGFKILQACLIGETSKALFIRATAK